MGGKDTKGKEKGGKTEKGREKRGGDDRKRRRGERGRRENREVRSGNREARKVEKRGDGKRGQKVRLGEKNSLRSWEGLFRVPAWRSKWVNA